MLPKTLQIRHLPTPEDLARAAAVELQGLLQRHVPTTPFGIALSGGRIAAKFYDSLVECLRPWREGLENVHFFWADERCVAPGDTESNYFTATRHLFDPLSVDEAQVHRIRGEVDSTYAVQEAEAELCRLMPLNEAGQPVLDLVILGMGEDGHVASLFPGEPEAMRKDQAVYRHVHAVKPPPERVTLGYAPILAAREVWVLASGAGKKEAFLGIFDAGTDLPIKHVVMNREKVLIFQDIASDLPAV